MNRLAKLRLRSSSGVGLNSSCQSLGNGAGYETANDESITSGCSLYYSVTEGDGTATNEQLSAAPEDAEQQQKKDTPGKDVTKEDHSIDATLENDFSVEEVSTIRKPMIVAASPATVKIASKMSCKYLGVSSTPAKVLCRSAGKNLSGIAKLNETDGEKQIPSAMKRMREPKLSEGSSADDGEESKMTLESSVQSVVEKGTPAAGHKSFGTNVLAQFFESLDVNKATPVPQIKVSAPDGVEKVVTPAKGRESNSLENFFESLKKNPDHEGKENKPQSERKRGVRKSLIPKIGETDRPRTRNSLFGADNHRVAQSPIVKPSRKSSTVRLIPDRLKEMRKATQSDLISVKRKSMIPPTKTIVAQVSAVPNAKKSVSDSEDVVGDSIRVGPNRNSMVPAPKVGGTATVKPVSSGAGLKRKSVAPPIVVSRRSVLPAKNLRRSVVSAPIRVPLKVPAKTPLTSSDTSRRTTLGKRPTTDIPTDKAEPLNKQRKSLAPAKEAKTEHSPKEAQSRPISSRIRPPSMAGPTGPTSFKKPETFSCETCQRPFRLKSSLETHKKLAHQAATLSSGPSPAAASKTPDTKCRYCSKSFINGKILSNHLISNCQKIPIPDKRKLLAQDDQERAKSSPSRTPNGLLKPPSVSGSATSLDTDTSTSSSVGDISANSSSASSRPASSGTGAIRKPGRNGVGHTGITRTPKKEMKCHLCNRRYLNAVEYALHVQAHAKGMESLEGKTTVVTTAEATKLVNLGKKA